jgi:hypothetical protein
MRMSGKGEPYDNALMESSLSRLKAECIERHDFRPPTSHAPASVSTWRSSTTGRGCTPH